MTSSFTSIIEEIFFAISPTMLSLMMWLFFGSVEIWHSYSPSSRACTYLTCRVQVSDASTKSAWNLSSGINMVLSTERICESLLRIHDTFCVNRKQQINFNNIVDELLVIVEDLKEILYSISCRKHKICKKQCEDRKEIFIR